MLKHEFPKFNGDNPHLWCDLCTMYFEVHSVSPSLKTSFAALNFKGASESSLQTLECRGRIEDWHAFRDAVFARFDKDQCKIQLRQFDSL